MAAQAAIGGEFGQGMCPLPDPARRAEVIAKYENAKKCLLRMPNKQCDDPLPKDRQKLVYQLLKMVTGSHIKTILAV